MSFGSSTKCSDFIDYFAKLALKRTLLFKEKRDKQKKKKLLIFFTEISGLGLGLGLGLFLWHINMPQEFQKNR